METRLESIASEVGTATELLLWRDEESQNSDTWRLDAKSFKLPGSNTPESPKTIMADCLKKFSKFHLSSLDSNLVVLLSLVAFSLQLNVPLSKKVSRFVILFF